MKTTGYIINGVYRAQKDGRPIEKDDQNITYKMHDRDRQREEHARDLLQPYSGGKPNPDFIAQYPDEAKGYGFIQ